jgi:hypothetical protein
MLGALMRDICSSRLGFAWICLLLFAGSTSAGCVGGVGTTCFQNDECDGELICCHIGSRFTQGSCDTQAVCDELRQNSGTGGSGGAGGEGGVGGTGGAGGEGGVGGTGGAGGEGGVGGTGGAGGEGGVGGAGGQGGAGGGSGSGGAPTS